METTKLFDHVCDSACELMAADRCTLFLIDHASNELWSQIAHESSTIKCPMGAGIAGAVATSGKILNIPNAYEDVRFNQEVDKKTGYTTHSILCCPLRATDSDEILGVLQVSRERSELRGRR